MEWIYYDEPWYNPLVGKTVVAYRESGEKKTRTLNLEYLCQGKVHFVEMTADFVFKSEEE